MSGFKPPSGAALAAVDVADPDYEDRCIVIEGVVSPRGQGSWSIHAPSYDVHAFAFAVWRRLGETLVEHELTLLRPVPSAQGGQNPGVNIFQQFPAFSIHRLSVLLSKAQTRAVVEHALPLEKPDEALLLLSERLRQPVVLSTEHFGELILNQQINQFEGKAEWNDTIVDISFQRIGDEPIDDSLKTAEALWSNQAVWKCKIEDFAVKELLPLKNDDWLAKGESKLSAADFKARMELSSVSIRRDGNFEFWHHDGDLFFGHWIQVRGNLKDGLIEADIPG